MRGVRYETTRSACGARCRDIRLDEEAFAAAPDISVDYAILERTDKAAVVVVSFGWSDLGTWNSAWENMDKDYFGNAVVGKNVVVVDANNCMAGAELRGIKR